MKYTHKVTLLDGPNKGCTFKVFINSGRVYISQFTDVNGIEKFEPESYIAHHMPDGGLTPEAWYSDISRWKVEKLNNNKFKGNK